MSDLISRQAAIDALWKALYEYEDKTEKQFQESDDLDVGDWIEHRIFVQNMNDIDRQTILNLPSAQLGKDINVPAADAIEELSKERTGVWITPRKNYCKCSACGMGFHHPVGEKLDNYCAECGAKMKGEIEMRKIDACPCCDCEEAYVESYEHHAGAIRYRVCCPKCGVYLDSGYWQTADRAIEEWNKRSNPMWWIPTKKQYPFADCGEGKSVLTVDSMGEKRVLYFDGGNWCWPTGEVFETAKMFPVTHWMPLPEPPKEEK